MFDEAAEGLAPSLHTEVWRWLGRLRGGGHSIFVIDKSRTSRCAS